MKQQKPAALSAVWDEAIAIETPGFPALAAMFIRKTFYIVQMEVQKLRRDMTELLTRAIQPALWLLVFGQVLDHAHAFQTGSASYIDFMTPGILAQSVLFIAIFYGISIIWERDLGIVHKFLVTPTPRAALVLGKAISAGIRALSQVFIVYLLATLLGVGIDWRPLSLLRVVAVVMLAASLFSTFSLIIACIVKTRERFMGIGQVMTMPMFFASNAIYPIAVMPAWLKFVSRINPLTYEVDGLRTLMLRGGVSANGLPVDFAVLILVTAVLVVCAGKLYPRVIT